MNFPTLIPGSKLYSLVLFLFLASTLPFSGEVVAETREAKPVLDFEDETLRERYYSLIDELRCPKCQNQNLADSDAPIAADLRNQLNSLLRQGKTDSEILDFMTSRYGTFVLYEPPMNSHTLVLWALPAGLALVGLLIIVAQTRLKKNRAVSAVAVVEVDVDVGLVNHNPERSKVIEAFDSASSISSSRKSAYSERIILLACVVFVFLCALALYAPWGLSLGADDQYRIRQQLNQINAAADRGEIEQRIEQLIRKLERYHGNLYADVEIRYLLADMYRTTGDYARQADVLEYLLKSEPDSASIMVSRAEALYFDHLASQKSMDALPTDIVSSLEAALEIQPDLPRALSLMGVVAYQQQEWEKALHYLKLAEKLYPRHSEQSQTMRQGIENIEARLGIAPNEKDSSPANITAAIKLRVSVDLDLADEIAPSTPVFVFARAVSGPPMPLAAKKLRYADLPTEVVLTNLDAMTAATIEGHSELKVGARVALSGQPLPKLGDYESEEVVVLANLFEPSVSSADLEDQFLGRTPTVLVVNNLVAK